MKWKKIKKWLLIVAAIYLAGGISLYFLQDAILFHPVTLKTDQSYNIQSPHRDISIAINNEDTLNLVQFLSTGSGSKGAVLYFHGNKKNISWYAKYSSYFTRHGYELIMIDYPGYGKSRGRFTEEILYQWANHVYRFAKSRYPSDSIIIYGKSMGTGIAARLASREKCSRLILETPYYDLPSVIQRYLPLFPVSKLLHYELPTHRYLQYTKSPVTILQGTDDGVIAYRNANRLRPFLKTTDEFITIEGGRHNDLFEFPQVTRKLDSLLNL